MKLIKFLSLAFLALPSMSFAQKTELINSADVIKKGIQLHDSTQYKKALQEYDKVSRSDTNYVWALYEKAVTSQADSQFTQTIKYCEEALALKELREHEANIYNVYGNTLNNMGQSERALLVFDKAIAKYPSFPLLYFNKAVTYNTLKNYEQAEEWFKKTLLINPYMNSAHYQLGMIALYRGKIVPAYLSLVGYLLIAPQGRYASAAIGALSELSKVTDDVSGYKNKRTSAPSADYQMVEEILLSKIALDRQYRSIIALDDQISRQIQVLFEKLEYNEADTDFWMQYYVPYYKQVLKNGQFEPFINHLFMNVNIDIIQNYIKKNKKVLEGFETEAGNYFNKIRATRQLVYTRRDTVTKQYVYEDGELIGYGKLKDGKTTVGPWKFLYKAGNVNAEGDYNNDGKREGAWKFYYPSGVIKTTESYKNGLLEGTTSFYYDNGMPSLTEQYVNNLLEGTVNHYYYNGNRKRLVNYKANKKHGEERTFFTNGNLKSIKTYVADELSGPARDFYSSGKLKTEATYVAGKTEGAYKNYFENGRVSSEMMTVKDQIVGECKAYYPSGKLKQKDNYVNSVEDGPHTEYYEDGKIAAAYTVLKGEVNGTAEHFTKAGKVYAKYLYDNGTVRSASYFDDGGKPLGTSVLKGNFIDIVSYKDGFKQAHFSHDKKGKLNGVDTIFYPSGKINQTLFYKGGMRSGLLTTYHLNGNRRSQINMTDDQEDGYYQSFYANGKPEVEGWLRAGVKEGEWIYYDQRGKITNKLYYVSDDLHGYKEDYDASGMLKAETKYDYGILDRITQYDTKGKIIAVDSFPKASGKYRLLHPSGKLQEEATYVNGAFDGAYNTYFFDGRPDVSLFYKKGALDSSYVSYFHNGIKHITGQYKNGEKTGTWKNYDDDGSLFSTTVYDDNGNNVRTYYTDGIKDSEVECTGDLYNGLLTKYAPDGGLAYHILFEDDVAKAYSYLGKDGKQLPFIGIINGRMEAFYANGKPSRVNQFVDGQKNGEMKIFYPDGKLRTSDISAFDQKQGPSKEYYANGNLKSEYVYIHDMLHGVGKEYYSNGTLKKELTYMNGNANGPVKYYDQQGKLVKTMVYDEDKLVAVTDEK